MDFDLFGILKSQDRELSLLLDMDPQIIKLIISKVRTEMKPATDLIVCETPFEPLSCQNSDKEERLVTTLTNDAIYACNIYIYMCCLYAYSSNFMYQSYL